MWLMGCPNPCKLEQKLECTFLKPFTQVKTKWASKKFYVYAIQSYQLHSKVDLAHQGWIGLTAWLVTLNGIGEKYFWCSFWFWMGKRFQKNALPFLFQFARDRAAHQPHDLQFLYFLQYFRTNFRNCTQSWNPKEDPGSQYLISVKPNQMNNLRYCLSQVWNWKNNKETFDPSLSVYMCKYLMW